MLKPTAIDDKKYLKQYKKELELKVQSLWEENNLANGSTVLSYHNAASAVFSSNIEGNSLNLNSFMNARLVKKKASKEVQENEDLINAYEFAQHHSFNEKNLLKAHEILSNSYLLKSKRGIYRSERVGVFSERGLVYLAVEPEFVKEEMSLFFKSLKAYLKMPLTIEEAFFFASLYHLKFVHIHPFEDGNGRVARLLEKWFLSQASGKNAWKISSEKYYWEHRQEYYQNINLGVNYYQLEYDKCLPFLLMLPNSIRK